MSWICLKCETSNPDSIDLCEVCELERLYTKPEVESLLVIGSGAPDAHLKSGPNDDTSIHRSVIAATPAKSPRRGLSLLVLGALPGLALAMLYSTPYRDSVRSIPPQVPSLPSGSKTRAENEAQIALKLVDSVVEDFLLLRKRKNSGLLTADEARTEQTKLTAQLKQALQHSESALALDSGNNVAWVQKARSQYYLSDYKAAQDTLRTAERQFPNDLNLKQLEQRISRRLAAPPG